jgi:hypothetical protein
LAWREERLYGTVDDRATVHPSVSAPDNGGGQHFRDPLGQLRAGSSWLGVGEKLAHALRRCSGAPGIRRQKGKAPNERVHPSTHWGKLPDEWGKPCTCSGKLPNEWVRPCTCSVQLPDEWGKACTDSGEPPDEWVRPCTRWGKPPDKSGEPSPRSLKPSICLDDRPPLLLGASRP